MIGFENGVYDLGKLEFRDGVYEDYMSMTTGINYYDHDEDDEHPLQQLQDSDMQILDAGRQMQIQQSLLVCAWGGGVEEAV